MTTATKTRATSKMTTLGGAKRTGGAAAVAQALRAIGKRGHVLRGRWWLLDLPSGKLSQTGMHDDGAKLLLAVRRCGGDAADDRQAAAA